jgi:hypothetical protein
LASRPIRVTLGRRRVEVAGTSGALPDFPTWHAYPLTTSQGLSGAEAAARLGMSVAVVFMAKRRVKGMLQEQIRTLEDQSAPSGTG